MAQQQKRQRVYQEAAKREAKRKAQETERTAGKGKRKETEVPVAREEEELAVSETPVERSGMSLLQSRPISGTEHGLEVGKMVPQSPHQRLAGKVFGEVSMEAETGDRGVPQRSLVEAPWRQPSTKQVDSLLPLPPPPATGLPPAVEAHVGKQSTGPFPPLPESAFVESYSSLQTKEATNKGTDAEKKKKMIAQKAYRLVYSTDSWKRVVD